MPPRMSTANGVRRIGGEGGRRIVGRLHWLLFRHRWVWLVRLVCPCCCLPRNQGGDAGVIRFWDEFAQTYLPKIRKIWLCFLFFSFLLLFCFGVLFSGWRPPYFWPTLPAPPAEMGGSVKGAEIVCAEPQLSALFFIHIKFIDKVKRKMEGCGFFPLRTRQDQPNDFNRLFNSRVVNPAFGVDLDCSLLLNGQATPTTIARKTNAPGLLPQIALY